MYPPERTLRTLIMGRNGAVGATHPLAAPDGPETLRVCPFEGPRVVQAIRVTENGERVAGSDPRHDGWAAAF